MTKWVSSLLFLFCLISFSNNVAAQVVLQPLTASPAIVCAGGTTTITATATGPTDIEYSIDGGPYSTINTFDVQKGPHTVTARDASNTSDSKTITISETLLSASVSGVSYICTPNTGAFTVNVSGGLAPYAVNVTGQTELTGAGPDFAYSGLAASAYQINVKDNCLTPATFVIADYVIALDNAKPTCTDLPVNEFVPKDFYKLNYLAGATPINIPLTFDKGIPINTSLHTGVDAFAICPNFPSNGFDNMQLHITATQIGSGWLSSDIVEVSISYGSGNLYPQVIQFSPGNFSDVIIPITRTDQDEVNVSISWGNIVTSGCYYKITSVELICSPVQSVIPSYSQPSGCVNNVGTTNPTLNPSDGPIAWFCTEPFSPSTEFSFTRTWEVRDDCGNIQPYSQLISVGTAPTFGPLPDPVTYDFCHNSNVPIPAPSVNDDCTASDNLTLEWSIFDTEDNIVKSWSSYSTGTTYSFSPLPAGQTFLICWRVTDQAGISTVIDASTTSQYIIFKPEIALELSTGVSPAIYNVCEGNAATFTISATGGTGSYKIISISPSPTQTLPLSFIEGGNATFTYDATNQITTTNSSITITYQDVDSGTPTVPGGCPASSGSITFNSGGVYTIHKKIATGIISRTP